MMAVAFFLGCATGGLTVLAAVLLTSDDVARWVRNRARRRETAAMVREASRRCQYQTALARINKSTVSSPPEGSL